MNAKINTMKVVRDGVSLAYHEAGGGDGSPILFVHGFGCSGGHFRLQQQHFASFTRTVAVDLRGHGASDAPLQDYSPIGFAEDLRWLCDHLDLKRPIVVGHSMGGNIAMTYGGIRPARVRRIVNLEGFGLPRTDPSQAPERHAKWLDQLWEAPEFNDYADADDLAARLVRRNPRLAADRASYIASCWTKSLASGGVRLRADPAHRLVNPYLYRREEMEACWRRLIAPVLMILGGKSEVATRLGTEGGEAAFRACIPDVRVEVLDDAGHMLHHEEPAAVARLIEDFLGSA